MTSESSFDSQLNMAHDLAGKPRVFKGWLEAARVAKTRQEELQRELVERGEVIFMALSENPDLDNSLTDAERVLCHRLMKETGVLDLIPNIHDVSERN